MILRYLARLALAFALLAGCAHAAEVDVCFDYGCAHRARAIFTDDDLANLRELVAPAQDAEQERALLADAIGRMYATAGSQTPIHRDRGRNPADERGLEGAMDCIDHSTNTATFLRVLDTAGVLRFHRPGERAHRFAFLFFGEHWTASVIENATGAAYAVDSWFFDPGSPAVVVPLARWKQGHDPGNKLSASP